MVTAEVINDDGEWVDLLVRDCTVATENTGHKVTLLAKSLEVRRKRQSIEKGKPERLLWSDEAARASLIRKTAGADEPAPPPA